jgi:hypothetical protein
MRARSVKGGSVLVIAAAVVAALVTSASGAVRSSDSTSARSTWEYPGGAPERLWYQRMNSLGEDLRQELNRTDPNPVVVAALKAQLQSLANR